MRLRLHFPSLIQAPAHWSTLQRERLQQVAAQAFVQAVALFNLPGIQIELVSAQQGKGAHSDTHGVFQHRREHPFAASSPDIPISAYTPDPTQNTPEVDRAQMHPIRADIHISNNNPGRSTDLRSERTQQRYQPVLNDQHSVQFAEMHLKSAQTFDTNRDSDIAYVDASDHLNDTNRDSDIASIVDSEPYPIIMHEADPTRTDWSGIYFPEDCGVIEEDFPEIAILLEKSGKQIHAGGPCIRAQNLVQALRGGAYLFTKDGFAVLQGEAFSSKGPFFVIPLQEPLQFEAEYTFPLDSGEQAISISASMLHTADYTVVVVVDDRGRSFFGNRKYDPWTYKQVQQELARLNPHKPAPGALAMNAATYAQADYMKAVPADYGIFSMIGWMDRTLFAALPWAKRYAYLTKLIAEWKGAQEKTLLLHIICSTRTEAELAAIFALLRRQGKYEKLFEHFDVQLYELLQMLGDFIPDYPLDWRYLATAVTHAARSSQAPHLINQETTQEPLEVASRLLESLVSRRIDFLFSPSEEMVVSPEELSLLLWLVRQARSGDRRAQLFLTKAVVQTDSAIEKAIRGLHYARGAGMPYHRRENASRLILQEKLQEKLHATFILKFLLHGKSEVRTALEMAEDPMERLDMLTKSLTSEHIIDNALDNLTEQMGRGLATLLEYPQWDRTAIINLLIDMPANNRHSFLYTMLFVAPAQLEIWELQTLQELAVHPRALALIREGGYELFAGVFQYVTYSWTRFDLFVERLAVKRRSINDPLVYQEFLDRLVTGEAEAFDEVDNPTNLLQFHGPE